MSSPREAYIFARADCEAAVRRAGAEPKWFACGCGCAGGVAWGSDGKAVWVVIDRVPIERGPGLMVIGLEDRGDLEKLWSAFVARIGPATPELAQWRAEMEVLLP